MNTKKQKVYVVGPSKGYASWLTDFNLTDTMKESDLVLFTGGEDVSPALYGEPVGRYTGFNVRRDTFEINEYKEARKLNKPMLGICRGAQFLCVMAGGRLVQDQENKYSVHNIETEIGVKMPITSTHHQAQYPYDMIDGSYRVIGWTENLSRYHLNGKDEEISEKPFKEAEIVFYPTINALGIQGHPEYSIMNKYPVTLDYLQDLVDRLLNKSL